MSKTVVLRLGHRPVRDKRVSTHVGLVARAFGADGIIYAEQNVKKVKESLEKVKKEWGGSFFVRTGESWKEVIDKWQSGEGQIVHLTMYGCHIKEKVSKIRGKDTLVVIGAEKVPKEVYERADYNVAVGNQPHSEIAALAVFLDRFYEGGELDEEFAGAEKRVIPSEEGKEVREL